VSAGHGTDRAGLATATHASSSRAVRSNHASRIQEKRKHLQCLYLNDFFLLDVARREGPGDDFVGDRVWCHAGHADRVACAK
jgi:hypothetical protein